MAFSPWTLLGQSLGSGFNQGFQNQLNFKNTLDKANQLSQLPQAQQSLALALLGGGGGSQGNPLDALLARMLAEQLGYGGESTPLPALPNPQGNTSQNPPRTGTESIITNNEKSTGQIPANAVRVQDEAGNIFYQTPDGKLYNTDGSLAE